jgi:hypothetical protein
MEEGGGLKGVRDVGRVVRGPHAAGVWTHPQCSLGHTLRVLQEGFCTYWSHMLRFGVWDLSHSCTATTGRVSMLVGGSVCVAVLVSGPPAAAQGLLLCCL